MSRLPEMTANADIDHLRQLGADVDCKLEIKPRYDMTIEQLVRLVREGHDIVYSPHLGNRSRGDMAVSRLGIRTILVNRNAAYGDKWDTPEFVRVGGRKLELVGPGQDKLLTPFAEADGRDANEVRAEFGAYGRTPAQIHFESNKAAVPGDYRINDAYMFGEDAGGERVADVLSYVSEDPLAHVFDREIAGGRIRQIDRSNLPTGGAQSFLDAVPRMVRNIEEGRTDLVETPIPSNSLMVIGMAIRAAVLRIADGDAPHDELDVYTVSGPEMIKYMHDDHLLMSYIYSQARKVEPRLPRTLRYNVFPGSALEFLPPADDTAAVERVDRLVWLELRKAQIDASLKDKSFKGDKAGLVAEKKRIMAEQDVDRAAFAGWRKDRAPYFHYDALRGRPLHDPKGLERLTFKAVDNLFDSRPA
jgi:hypothetical protein